MRILIVDDLEENRYLMEFLLKGDGYEVVQARNGAEGLERLKEGPVDMIISDILMPVMDGFQLCREVKKDPHLGKIPFVFYTATYTDKKDEEFALALGADKFIVKPTEPEFFLTVLKDVIRKTQADSQVSSGESLEEEEVFLAKYNQRLIQKLEKKMLDLENVNRKLKESEEKYRTLVEGANEVILIAQEGQVKYINSKAADIFNHPLDEITARPFADFIHSEDREMVLERHLRRAEGNQIPSIYSFRIINQSGLVKWVEINSVGVSWEGQPATLNFLTDITERKKAEEALQASEKKYRKLYESMRDGLVSVDMTGRITECNDSYLKMLGYEREEILALTYLDLTPEKWRSFEAEIIETQILPKGYSEIYQKEYRRKDGTVFPVELRTILLRDEAGDPYGMWAIIRDISERRRAEEERVKIEQQLLQAQKMESIGRLAGGVAHDFNNLLAAILGNAELLLTDFAPEDPRRKQLDQILQAGKRAADLTYQLLSFSRKQIIDLKPVDLRDVLEGFKRLLRRMVREDIRIEIPIGKKLGLVRADVGQIEQVLMNLAVNAQDAMPDGGMLILELSQTILDSAYAAVHQGVVPGEYIMLAVSDTGTGMDQETLRQIFDPFFTTKEKGKGTGLGLAMVYGIIKQHGGHIWVYSEPGRGTTFRIYLPLIREKIEGQEESPAMTGELLGGTEAILVVEDDEVVRGMVRQILERQGYRMILTRSAQEAEEVMEKKGAEIDLLLSDVIMPGLNGKELYHRLTGYHPGLKVLYMSGYTDDVIAHHGVLDQGVLFIQKPFSIQALALKVREALDVKPSSPASSRA